MKDINKFIALTIGISWLIWLPLVLQSLGIISGTPGPGLLKLLGALSPAAAGLTLTGISEGSAGVRKLLKNSFTAYRSIGWLIFVLGGHMLITFIARMIFGLFETELPESVMVTGPGSFVFFTVAVFFFGGGLDEEIGWRGFLAEKLLNRMSPIKCIVLTGAIWIIWHLPLFWISGTNQKMLNFVEFAIPVAALNIMITWMYWRTRSVLLCALFHTFGNVSHEVFRVIPTDAAPNPLGFYIFTALIVITALLMLILDTRLYEKEDIMEQRQE